MTTPALEFLDQVIEGAVTLRASDIHFEPFDDAYAVRVRAGGVLRPWLTTPKPEWAVPISSKLKVSADLDVAEQRLPQDGRCSWKVADRWVDLRISTLPTAAGESVVIRILDSRALGLEVPNLGLSPEVLTDFERTIEQPDGLIVVTGPTSSGKTTTLYAALRRLNSIERKIVSVEDPVEYDLDGVVQVAVKPELGVTFATSLRSFLRQDPDVIMIGEIRDAETADVAVQAALTGHLVLATMHTNTAVGAAARLVELGVEPYLVGSALKAVLSQRLIRTFCAKCQRDATSTLTEVATDDGDLGDPGCPLCQGTGYAGRAGLFEWLPFSSGMQDLLARGELGRELEDAAASAGYERLAEAAERMVGERKTSRFECERVGAFDLR